MLKNPTRTTNHHKDNLLQAGSHTWGFFQHPLSATDVHRTGLFFSGLTIFWKDRIF